MPKILRNLTVDLFLPMHDILIGLGSNLGDRETTLRKSWEKITQLDYIKEIAISKLYETQPVGGPPGQPMFLNAVGRIQTDFYSPQALLTLLQGIENDFGRVRTERWAARTLDLDILLFGNLVIFSSELSIPHPRLAERRFALEPALEIAAEMILPTNGRTIRDLFDELIRHENSTSYAKNDSP